ncbi:lipid kinase YegS [Verrucomicrobiaceae bacterium N1E253]|uniref:Lipid kinase YegS n=1 Tax=Oceaniferula marina TaxID=2748318 RepID=A0A851GE10_9BACT|nr:lipid kinase YegS [Oceaniferula marina]NWK55783.1 lipid kinase YegS [Oceaniferula marina]
MKTRLIINGKKAGLDPVRDAVFQAREFAEMEVRPTWEGGDVQRLVAEAAAEGCQRIIAGGGDGTVNEAVDAILQLPADQQPELALLPLGTANDFATACTIPADYGQALRLAQTGTAVPVDAARANERHFINVASAGFGAQVTTSTPVALKNFLGGGAYTLSGLVQAVNFTPYAGTVRAPGVEMDHELVIGAVCNGRQAGGGQQLAPKAVINDGLFDVVSLRSFPADAVSQVIRELLDSDVDGEYVQRRQVAWLESSSEVPIPVNLDGEPIESTHIRFEVVPGAVRMVLPAKCPLLDPNG